MQSSVASAFDAPTFYPTLSQFANFKNYIAQLEAIEPKISFAKVCVCSKF